MIVVTQHTETGLFGLMDELTGHCGTARFRHEYAAEIAADYLNKNHKPMIAAWVIGVPTKDFREAWRKREAPELYS